MAYLAWRRRDTPGLELARIEREGERRLVRSRILLLDAGTPLVVDYRIELGAGWRTREVDIDSLAVQPSEQRYRRLAPACYRYTSLSSGFSARVDVDAEGFPTLYERLGQRA